VFDDGTFEGDAEIAAAVRGYRAGEKLVLPRLIPLLDGALSFTDTNLIEALKKLEAQVSSVVTDADPKIVQTLSSEFPQDGSRRSGEIKATMEVTSTTIKSNLLKEIHVLQNERAESLNVDLYRAWLTKTRERYEKWLARL
jgi:hypothetical protein